MLEPLQEFFDKSGPLPPSFNDLRRFPRFYFRSCADATIYPICEGEPDKAIVLTRDLSRSGLSFLYNRQLYPGQRVDIELDSLARSLVVIWCRRQDETSYLIGCQFQKADG